MVIANLGVGNPELNLMRGANSSHVDAARRWRLPCCLWHLSVCVIDVVQRRPQMDREREIFGWKRWVFVFLGTEFLHQLARAHGTISMFLPSRAGSMSRTTTRVSRDTIVSGCKPSYLVFWTTQLLLGDPVVSEILRMLMACAPHLAFVPALSMWKREQRA
jgi:hypothetical protein